MAFEVKVCGITRLEDAETALTAGANYLGFIQYPKSPRKISLDSSKSIMQSVGNFSFGKVAVDVCPTSESVVQMKNAGFDFYQFHFPYDFDPEKIRQWSELVGPSSKKWVLAGGIGPRNVVQAIQMTNPAIIDLNSRVESQPGIKDKEKIETVFKFISDL